MPPEDDIPEGPQRSDVRVRILPVDPPVLEQREADERLRNRLRGLYMPPWTPQHFWELADTVVARVFEGETAAQTAPMSGHVYPGITITPGHDAVAIQSGEDDESRISILSLRSSDLHIEGPAKPGARVHHRESGSYMGVLLSYGPENSLVQVPTYSAHEEDEGPHYNIYDYFNEDV